MLFDELSYPNFEARSFSTFIETATFFAMPAISDIATAS